MITPIFTKLAREIVRKKQIRIADIDQIKLRYSGFVNRNVTVVLNDNTTIFGELNGLEDNKLLITNTRQKKIKLPLGDVNELFTDIDA